ncbi:hypothetical protein LAZ67_3004547 [Cordylochernes scorpioides]|uniref:Transposase n=1 Tax=Cordylochernes scorpioides TaxID=51811 RepID=A0ABY6KCN1_9ARAC|nr:hypothetical protein LAZ67_3004547 [Cordylochernes scorpioides]
MRVKPSLTIIMQNLVKQLRKAIKEKRRGKLFRKIVYHQDNAPSHRSLQAMAAIYDSGFELLSPAPYSPDLAPSDFQLFPHLKESLYGIHFRSDEEVIDAVTSFFESLKTSFFMEGIKALEHRRKKNKHLVVELNFRTRNSLEVHRDLWHVSRNKYLKNNVEGIFWHWIHPAVHTLSQEEALRCGLHSYRSSLELTLSPPYFTLQERSLLLLLPSRQPQRYGACRVLTVLRPAGQSPTFAFHGCNHARNGIRIHCIVMEDLLVKIHYGHLNRQCTPYFLHIELHIRKLCARGMTRFLKIDQKCISQYSKQILMKGLQKRQRLLMSAGKVVSTVFCDSEGNSN